MAAADLAAPCQPGLVSLCIPVYNGMPYLPAALAAAQAQDYPQLEILVIDDGSRDAGPAWVEAAAASDGRIRFERNAHNLGLTGNWNRCVARARGEWIKFLFQDDLLAPDCVRRLVALAQARATRLAACRREFLFEDGVGAQDRRFYGRAAALVDEVFAGRDFLPADELALLAARYLMPGPEGMRNFIGEPTVTLVHRSLFAELGGYDGALAQVCDLEFLLRAGSRCGVAMLPAVAASFRVHRSATSLSNQRGGYRRIWLEPAIMLDLLLHAPAHAPLRARVQAQGRLPALRAELWRLVHYAGGLARAASGAEGEAMRTQWSRFIAERPHLARVPLRQHLHRLLARLRPAPKPN